MLHTLHVVPVGSFYCCHCFGFQVFCGFLSLVSTAGLHCHGWAPPLPCCCKFRVDAAGGVSAVPAGASALQGAGHPEGWSSSTTALPAGLRCPVCHCWCFCAHILWRIWCNGGGVVSITTSDGQTDRSTGYCHPFCFFNVVSGFQVLAVTETQLQLGLNRTGGHCAWSESVEPILSARGLKLKPAGDSAATIISVRVHTTPSPQIFKYQCCILLLCKQQVQIYFLIHSHFDKYNWKKINDKKKGANYYWRLLSRARCENLTGCKWPSAREFETTAYEPVPDEVPVDFPTCFSSCSLTACCFWLRYGAWSPPWPTWRVTSHSPRTPGDSHWSLVLCDWLPSSNLLVKKIHSVFFLGHLER